MSAQEFLSNLSQAIYLVLFVTVAVRFARRPGWASFDTFLFFAVIATLLLAGDAARILGFEDEPALSTLNWIGVTALPYILLRLIDDFRPRPTWNMVAAGAAFVVVAAIGVIAPQPRPPAVSLVPVAYVVVVGLYASFAFLREAMVTFGVTRRRMQAVAIGSGLLATVLLLAGVQVVFPESDEVVPVINQVLGLGIVLSYYAGFAPPAFLRRAWQEPALRSMLAESAELVQLPDRSTILERFERRAAAVTGAEGAAIGLWDEAAGVLRFKQHPVDFREIRPGEFISGRAFEQQRAIFTGRAGEDAPEHASTYRERGVQAIGAAPITSGEHRVGVVAVYAARPPAFTDDVLSLLEILAEQAALVLRSHQLLQEAAQVHALAEVTRLKDDFLSVVAHDVRTPLTTILLNAELLENSLRDGGPAARRAASLRTEALRLKQLVEDYLDVVRAEHGREPRREPNDLAVLVHEAVTGMGNSAARVTIVSEASATGSFDAPRIRQLVQNLVSNAIKYSAPEAPVRIEVGIDADHAVLHVTDEGIGIPESDLGLLFQRFHRGTNTDDRRYAGLGLGLYICRQIAEEHGGEVQVRSRVGEGTTFTVRLERFPDAEKSRGAEATLVQEPAT